MRVRLPFAGAVVAGALIALALAIVPTPFYLIAPGSAVDLRSRIAIDGHAPPREPFYLTDVIVRKATVLLLASALFPGVRLVKADDVVPSGVAPEVYDERLVDAMKQSQDIAAVVAERAAGLHVAVPAHHLWILSLVPASKARAQLRAGDELRSIDGVSLAGSSDVARLIARHRPGERARVAVVRDGRALTENVTTIATAKGARLGIVIESRYERPALPVSVRFQMDDIAGSSGGLMFALDIYRSLHRTAAYAPSSSIAGTGTLAYDGSVGPIEGTLQKLIAAKRAGARVFFVPRDNYADVAGERDVRIVPVGSFADALRSLPVLETQTKTALLREAPFASRLAKSG